MSLTVNKALKILELPELRLVELSARMGEHDEVTMGTVRPPVVLLPEGRYPCEVIRIARAAGAGGASRAPRATGSA